MTSESTEAEKTELINLIKSYTPEHVQRVRELVARCPDPDLDSYWHGGFPLFGYIAFYARKPGYEKLLEILLDAGYKSSNINRHILSYAVSTTLTNGTERAVKIIINSLEYDRVPESIFRFNLRSISYCISGIFQSGIKNSSERTLPILLAYGAQNDINDFDLSSWLVYYSKHTYHTSQKYVIGKFLEAGTSATAPNRFETNVFEQFVLSLCMYKNVVECTEVLSMLIADTF